MWYFTLEEAEALIPKLEELFSSITGLRERLQEKIQGLGDFQKSPTTDSVSLAIAQSQTDFLKTQIKEILQEIAELGALVRSLNPCVVNFPGQVEGKDVYLCWKVGEKFISYYHSQKESFEQRRLLPIKFTADKFENY